MYYTYILQSKKDGYIYIGHTDDLKRRFLEHQSGRVESTAPRRPFELIYYEACLERDDAITRERNLKTGFGRQYIKRRLAKYFDGLE